MGVRTVYLTAPQVRALLGVGAWGWRRVLRQEGFPAPERAVDRRHRDPGQDGPWWEAQKVYRWAAGSDAFRHRAALLHRDTEADQTPGRWLAYRQTRQGPALDWQTALGVVRIIYTERSGAASAGAAAAAGSNRAEDADVAVVCALFGDIGIGGPALVAADTAQPRIEYEARWDQVTELAGQEELPWWPHHLRLPEVIGRWQPGAAPLAVKVPESEREQTLHQAAVVGVFGSGAVAALLDMADRIHSSRVANTRMDIRVFGSGIQSKLGTVEWPIVIPVVLDELPDADEDDDEPFRDEAALAEGWREIAAASHPLAAAALEVAFLTDEQLLPYGPQVTVTDETSPVAERWARRLTPCDPTAAHAALVGEREAQEFFVDPLTAMPAAKVRGTAQDKHEGGASTWLFFAPTVLPPGGELASVVLDRTVWAVMSDGSVHPAPCAPTQHLWWGDGWGDRPTEASFVVDHLLDAPAAAPDFQQHWKRAPAGLTALLSKEHQAGAELTRAVLLHARMTQPRR